VDLSRLPSDYLQLISAFRRQLRFYLRTLRYVGCLGFVLVVGGAVTGVTIAEGSSMGTAAASLASGLGSIATLGIIFCALIGGDAIAMDFGSGTGYFMLVLPVRRAILLLGRYLGAFVVTVSLVLVIYAFAIFATAWFYGLGGIPWADVGASFLLALLFVASVLATAFFFSSFFRSPAMSIVTTILVLFLGLDIADGILVVTGIEPWFSILYAGEVISNAIVPVAHKTVTQVAGLTITTYSPYQWEGAVIMVAYLVVFLFLSIVIYQRKESKG